MEPNYTPLSNVPRHLAIRVLHSDDDLVVIDKPCDLRSVPGHANPPPADKEGPRPGTGGGDAGQSSHRRTAQEAWVSAIESIGKERSCLVTEQEDSVEAAVRELLIALSTTANASCVPRKLETFIKYCYRNSKRLLPSFPDLHNDRNKVKGSVEEQQSEPKQKKQKCERKDPISPMMRNIAQASYARIQDRQRPLMNLPKPTEDWESAIGQLRLLGFGDYSHNVSGCSDQKECAKLHVVHRLDCQVSTSSRSMHFFARCRLLLTIRGVTCRLVASWS